MENTLQETSSSPSNVQGGIVNFVNVFHFHQPIGQFHSVFEEAYQLSYDPLLTALENHPGVKTGIHITGPLLEWLEEHKPEFIERLKRLIERNQIEIIGGGYYEPILAIIPEEDRLAQLTMLSEKVKDLFGTYPRGAWLAERAWEPGLADTLHDAGLEFIFIDDFHIKNAGTFEPEIHHTFVTENKGKRLLVFPINEPIRYLIPWKDPQNIFDYMKDEIRKATKYYSREISFGSYDQSLMISNIDDAEKLGMWPGTHARVYGKNNGSSWIETWFSLTENTPWVLSLLPSEYIDKYPPKGLVYLPSASYDKMGVWALPTKERRELEYLHKYLKSNDLGNDLNRIILKYLKGSFWRNFLVKYPESNNMHKRMLFSRKKLLQAEKLQAGSPELKRARKNILAAQCNDVYWHGQFGGVYFYFMRYWTYRYLLMADEISEKILSETYINLEMTDYNYDGSKEAILENSEISAFIDPRLSFSLIELDFKPTHSNLITTLRSVEESYHENDEVIYDLWTKNAFIDYQLKNTTVHEFIRTKNPSNIAIQGFSEPIELRKEDLKLSAWTIGSWGRKEYVLEKNNVSVQYEMIPENGVIEINVSLDDDKKNISIAGCGFNGFSDLNEVVELPINSNELKIHCTNPMEPIIVLRHPLNVSRILLQPITPVSIEEGKLMKTFQGFTIYFHFEKETANEQFTISIHKKIP